MGASDNLALRGLSNPAAMKPDGFANPPGAGGTGE